MFLGFQMTVLTSKRLVDIATKYVAIPLFTQ